MRMGISELSVLVLLSLESEHIQFLSSNQLPFEMIFYQHFFIRDLTNVNIFLAFQNFFLIKMGEN